MSTSIVRQGIMPSVFTCSLSVSYISLPLTCRCVADEQRTLSLGVQSLLFRAFGAIPGPIVYGVIFDSTCTYWQRECGRRGNCWTYNNRDLTLRISLTLIFGISIYIVFSFLTWLFYPSQSSNQEPVRGKSKSTDSSSDGSDDANTEVPSEQSDDASTEVPPEQTNDSTLLSNGIKLAPIIGNL